MSETMTNGLLQFLAFLLFGGAAFYLAMGMMIASLTDTTWGERLRIVFLWLFCIIWVALEEDPNERDDIYLGYVNDSDPDHNQNDQNDQDDYA